MMDCIFAMICKALAAINSITTFADYFPLQLLVAVFYLYSAHLTGAQGYTQNIQHLCKCIFAEVLGIAFDVNQKCADKVCSGASESEKYFGLVLSILGQAHGSETSL